MGHGSFGSRRWGGGGDYNCTPQRSVSQTLGPHPLHCGAWHPPALPLRQATILPPPPPPQRVFKRWWPHSGPHPTNLSGRRPMSSRTRSHVPAREHSASWSGRLGAIRATLRRGRGAVRPPVLHVVHRWFLYGALDSHPFILHRMMQCRSSRVSACPHLHITQHHHTCMPMFMGCCICICMPGCGTPPTCGGAPIGGGTVDIVDIGAVGMPPP